MHCPLNVKFSLCFTIFAQLGQEFGKGDFYQKFQFIERFFFSSAKIAEATAIL